MTVSPLIWILTIVLIVGLLAFDYFFHVRQAHVPTIREAAIWSSIYVGIALLFGVAVLVFGGATMGTEYFAGYITEKALSVDNLFVFLVIIGSFAVPREDQQKVLLFGITFAIIARTGLIFVGAAMIEHLSWAFYFFGLILLYTAIMMLRPDNGNEGENFIIRIARRIIPTSEHYDGDRLTTRIDGKRVMTPMLLVMVAIGGTDILFALDSVPAIFGLTQNTYIVFTATVFSLLGLRQLYFLIDGLLERLVYLSLGLATILAFIGVKLIFHALHENTLGFINGGESVPVPDISTGFSLTVILGVLTVTIVASLISPKGKAKATISRVRRDSQTYIEMSYADFEERRETIYRRLSAGEEFMEGMPSKYDDLIDDEPMIRELLSDVHALRSQREEDTATGQRRDVLPEGLITVLPDGTIAHKADGTVTRADEAPGRSGDSEAGTSAAQTEDTSQTAPR